MHVLIADDNEVSLQFLVAACRSLNLTCVAVADGGAAIEAASCDRFDAMLLDLRMPVTGGTEVMHELRKRGIGTIAIATTADLTSEAAGRLRAEGFADAIDKPVSIERLAGILRKHGICTNRSVIAKSSATSRPLLDDNSALASIGGDWNTLRALRKLLAAEIEIPICVDVSSSTETTALSDGLHRLRASCGFCGAAILADAALKLQSALVNAENVSIVFAEFLQARTTTLNALIQSDRGEVALPV